MKKHFVTFLSLGTIIAEQTTERIGAWDIGKAIERSKGISERYGAVPHAFYFTTRGRGPDDLDSKEVQRSGTYFLGGDVLTLDQVKARNDPNDRILIFNMEGNAYDRVVMSKPSGWTQPLRQDDVVLDVT